jgi:hypothetical protein
MDWDIIILVLSGVLIAAVLLAGCIDEVSNNAPVTLSPTPPPTTSPAPTSSPTPTPEATPSTWVKKEIHQDFDATPALAGLLEGAWIYPSISNITEEDIGFEVTMTDDVAIPMYDIGKPMVPYIVKWYKIPTNSDVESVTVNLSGPIEIHNIFIEPVPEPPRAEYMIDNETYSSNEPYPGKEYEYRLTGDPIRGKGVVVWIFPIQYIPAESRIVACRNASISIVYRVPAGEGEK